MSRPWPLCRLSWRTATRRARRRAHRPSAGAGGGARAGVGGRPRGTGERGEALPQAALREVAEETGLQVSIEREVGSISYWFIAEGVRYHKTVHFYLMTATGGSVDQHDWEFDRVQWFPVAEALAVMTHPNERAMMEKALDLLAAPSPGAAGREEA